jgi:hypothetical protein
MTLTPLTVLIVAFALFEIVRVLLRISQDRMGIRSGLVWAVAWLAVGSVAIFPDLLNWVLEISQMQNRLLFALVLAVLFLLALVFGLTSRLERAERAMWRAHQELAIANARLDQLASGAGAAPASGLDPAGRT